MTTLYGTSLPPGLESSTKGELRIRIDKLILDDELLNNNPLLQTSFAQNIKNNITTDHKARKTRNSNVILTNSNTVDNINRGGGGIHDSTSSSYSNSNNSGSFINKRKFNIPVDYCSVSPHFWGEAKPSASCIPATPRQLQRGAITIIYLVKVKESAFAEYLHNMTCSSHRGLHLDVFVPSSYSGRKPIFVGQCVIDLDDLSATKHLDGWFTLTHNTNVDLNELGSKNDKKHETSTRSENENGIIPNAKVHDELTAICTSIPIGRVKVSFQLVYFSKAPIRLLHKKKSNRVSFILPSKENEHDAQDKKNNNINTDSKNIDHGDNDETTQKLSSSTPVKVALDQNVSSVEKTNQASPNDEKKNEENSKNKLAEHRESYFEELEENKREQKQETENKSEEVNLTQETENTENAEKHTSTNISKTNAQGKEEEGVVEFNKVSNSIGSDKNDDTSKTNDKDQKYGAKSDQNAWPLAFTASSSSPSSFASTLDELLHKSKLLRDRMAQAITLDSKVKHSTKAVHDNNIGGSIENNNKKSIKKLNKVNNVISTNEKLSHPSTVIVMDSNSESSNTVEANNCDSNDDDDDDNDDIVYTSELSDEEDRLLQLSRQRSLNKSTAHTPVHQTPTPKDKLRSHSKNELTSVPTSHVRLISSAQPTLFARDNSMLNHKAMSLPVDYMRKRNIMGCTLVELNFSNLSFAANMKTTDLSKLRINVKLSADITTSTPTAGPFSSFVHALPLNQPSICLSFDIQSYSEDVSRLVIEFFKVSTVNTSVRDGSAMYKTYLSSSSSNSSSSSSSEWSEEQESPAAADVLVHTPKRYNQRNSKSNRPMHSNQNENNHHHNHHYKQNKNARKETRYANRHEVEETTDSSHKLHLATPSTNICRDVISEELLGLCIVGLYSQERTIALRDPVGDVVNVYAHLQLALREPINIISDSKKTKKQESSNNNNVDEYEVENNNIVNAKPLRNSNDYHYHHEHSLAQEKCYHREILNGNRHEKQVLELPSKHMNSSGLIVNRFNHCINRKYITETNKHIRLRVEIVNAQDIPLVCIGKNENAQQHVMHPTPIHHNTDVKEHQELTRYTKPNTFCVIDDVYMKRNMPCSNERNGCSANCELDYLSPVEDWYVESYTNGYYDRSAVIWHNQRPQYNFSSVLTILENNSTHNRECNAENEQVNNTTHHSIIDPGKEDGNMLSNLQEVRLTLWHCALPEQNSSPNRKTKVLSYAERDVDIDIDEHHKDYSKSIMPFDSNNETMFWAHSGELGECRIDLQPLRYLPTLDGYYPIIAKNRSNNNSNSIKNNIDEDWLKSDASQSTTGEQIIGYLHVCISLLEAQM